MELYRLERPDSAPFDAVAYVVGTRIPAVPGGRCLECYATNKGVGPPLVLAWTHVPEHIPDFAWPLDGGVVVVSQRVREAFVGAGIKGVEFSPVGTSLAPPRRVGSAPRKYVNYTGPPLWLLQPTTLCYVDSERSNVRFRWRCSTCGHGHYDLP